MFVVDRYLFARNYVAQREEDQLAVERSSEGVRCAAVIDIVRAVTAATAVDAPAMIDTANTQDAAIPSTFGFGV